jgi:hypothetical protein
VKKLPLFFFVVFVVLLVSDEAVLDVAAVLAVVVAAGATAAVESLQHGVFCCVLQNAAFAAESSKPQVSISLLVESTQVDKLTAILLQFVINEVCAWALIQPTFDKEVFIISHVFVHITELPVQP